MDGEKQASTQDQSGIPVATPPSPATLALRRRVLLWSGAALAVLLLGVVLAAYFILRSSLPQLDGELAVRGIGAAARVERDAMGVPVITAQTRRDLAFATGFTHAQDRYFQMDLLRRAAAGELAELLGPQLVQTDRQFRIHGFRRVARQVLAQATDTDRKLIDAYVAGVNQALDRAVAKPWEYLLLGQEPRRWQPEDSILTAFSMYLSLNDSTGAAELARSQLREALPPRLFDFMHPLGTEWDAPIDGGTWRPAEIPGPDVFDLRQPAQRTALLHAPPSTLALEERPVVGSNNWVVSGTRTASGVALLANDMHLQLRLPHIWYRARMVVPEGPESRDLIGVTLPGLPMLIAGSNGKVAWGYTNTHGDWTDLVVVEADPGDPSRYRLGEEFEKFQTRQEIIQVRNAAPVTFEVKTTRWGPIVEHDAMGHELALAWTAHDAEATNLGMLDFETATKVEDLLDRANRAGGPVQNIVTADAAGHIGWSWMGRIPLRANYDPTVPASWREPGTGWTGWREPQQYPRVTDPAPGRIWTANARTIDAETWLAFMGDGSYDLGARAGQIRDGLFALDSASEMDMVNIQLDDRALFLTRWRDLLLDLLDEAALEGHDLRRKTRELADQWSAHASIDDAGYRLVRAFRLQVRKDVFDALTAAARTRYPDAEFTPSAQFEGALWQLVTQRPRHLLDPRYSTWEAALLASVDAAVAALLKECGELERCTWGQHNMLSIRHPLSSALPFAASWLDMPAEPAPGDAGMPRVQGAQFGASERLVVSPGLEAQGYYQMPGGQVDHPLSPFYGAGHEAWVRGEPQPLLPGDAEYTLRLEPER